MSPRPSPEATTEGRHWIGKLERARQSVAEAELERDELVRQARASGLSVRAIARALGIDKGTVSRRYPVGPK